MSGFEDQFSRGVKSVSIDDTNKVGSVPLSEKLLLSEFSEAWNHYRHVETMRTQYLGFFFAMMIAYVGFSVSIVQVVKHKPLPLLGLDILNV